jgi:hypothetical protein
VVNQAPKSREVLFSSCGPPEIPLDENTVSQALRFLVRHKSGDIGVYGYSDWPTRGNSVVCRRDAEKMRYIRLRSAHVLISVIIGVVLSLLPNCARSQDNAVGIKPVLLLEKSKYVFGESIRFWIGVEPKNSPRVSQEFRKPCSLTITKPDGTTEIQTVGWPSDGMPDRGWLGGWGFGESDVMAGVYTLVLECGAEKTRPLELAVERNGIFDQIKAQFAFETSGTVGMRTPMPVTLTVQNNSEYTIRFPERGVVGEGVFVSVVREEPKLHADLFYPWEKLTNSPYSFDTYSWDVTATIPSVVLKPGENFVQRFSVEDAYSFDQSGHYEITFATVLPILAGEKDGPFADLCPIRVLVMNKAQFTVTDSR